VTASGARGESLGYDWREPMEVKFDQVLSREELADYLTSLGSQVRQGELQIAGVVQKLPAQSTVEIHVKEKKGQLKIKLNVMLSTLEFYDQERRQAVEQVTEKFSVVKKRLGSSFANLKKAVAPGKFPEETLLKEFLTDCKAFALHIEPEWQAEMDIYLSHVKNLEQAFTIGNFDMFQHEMADLKVSMARCHQDFK
jgi:XXXCH domain-containing protein